MAPPTLKKEDLLSKLLEGVKSVQARFGSRTELATEDEESVRTLCTIFEDILLHGLITKPTKGKGRGPPPPGGEVSSNKKGLSFWQMTEALVPSSLIRPSSIEAPSFWPLIKAQLSNHEAERFLLLHSVRTDFGRGRAWLRAALNEHALERYIHTLLCSPSLQDHYEGWAFLRDPELSSILPQTAAGLGSVLFALVVENPVLDSVTSFRTPSKEEAVASPVEVAEVADQFLAASSAINDPVSPSTTNMSSPPPNPTSSGVKKKRRKAHVNVVSFDDDDQNDTTKRNNDSLKTPLHRVPSQSSSNSNASSATTPTPTETHNKQFSNDNNPPSPLITSPVQITTSQTDVDKEYHDNSMFSTSVKSQDCISINSIYSDCSERLDIDGINLDFNFGAISISPSQRLKPVRDRGPDNSNSSSRNDTGGLDSDTNNDENEFDSSSQDLIPLPNFDPSFPSAPQLLTADDDDSSSRINVQGKKSATTAKRSSTATPKLVASPPGVDSATEGGEERVQKLKAILDREIESVTTLQAQLAEEKRRGVDTIKILEARVECLTKDNEVLKHQLNKYIGAVQLLKKERNKGKGTGGRKALERRESSFEEEDDEQILQQLAAEGKESTTEGEGAEYERKLIQVAEMHGELMEFNSHLQSSLRRRDLVIRRLREELVDLRGPLAAPLVVGGEGGGGTGGGFDDESWDIVDSGTSYDGLSSTPRQIQLTHNERVLINIWIPSAFLTGANTDLHHVYQVFLRIKDTEWNVYRRYSQFYSLHRDLKKKDPVIGSFYFPPKKHLGNKDGKFVDERRRKLQDYLRLVINHTLQTNSILSAHPDKNLLISIFPFFGENTFVHGSQKKKERGRGRNLFFLSSNNSHQVQNSASGFQTSIQYPQYTGL